MYINFVSKYKINLSTMYTLKCVLILYSIYTNVCVYVIVCSYLYHMEGH